MSQFYTIALNYPNMPRGQELQIAGLGTYKNRSGPHVVSPEEAASFKTYQADLGMPEHTLLEAFRKDEYVTVETYEPPKEGSEPKTDPQDAQTKAAAKNAPPTEGDK